MTPCIFHGNCIQPIKVDLTFEELCFAGQKVETYPKHAFTRWIRPLIFGLDKATLQLMFQIFHLDRYLDIELNTPTNMGEISHANI